MEIIDKNNWRKDIRRRQQHYGMLYYHTRHNLSEIQNEKIEEIKDEVFDLQQLGLVIKKLIRDGLFEEKDPPN